MSLTPLELALGLPLGTDPPVASPAGRRVSPMAALEASLAGALRRPPCLVSFSGGRDSSAVLAVATRVARRQGVPDPIPATIRASDAPAAQESQWQELAVRHLGLGEWLRLEFSDELDLVGPVAAAALHRHGLLWPFNAHFHIPLLEAARGGTLLTGIGGDELFRSATSPRAVAVLSGRVRPDRRDMRRVAMHLAPRAARRRWHGHRAAELRHPWLTPAADERARRAIAAWEAAEPRRLRSRMSRVRAARYLRVGTGSLEHLAHDCGAAIRHPLLEPEVWAAVVNSAPAAGYVDRTHAMKALFGSLLPGELLARPDKASFDEVFFNQHSRAFAARWSGGGVPEDLVDAHALRNHWLAGAPQAQSFSLLQAAWLAAASGGRDEPLTAVAPNTLDTRPLPSSRVGSKP